MRITERTLLLGLCVSAAVLLLIWNGPGSSRAVQSAHPYRAGGDGAQRLNVLTGSKETKHLRSLVDSLELALASSQEKLSKMKETMAERDLLKQQMQQSLSKVRSLTRQLEMERARSLVDRQGAKLGTVELFRKQSLIDIQDVMDARGLGEHVERDILHFHWMEDLKDTINRHGRYLFRKELTNRGFMETLDPYGNSTFFIFQGNPTHAHAIDKHRFRRGLQLINHFSGEYYAWNKEHLIENVKEWSSKAKCDYSLAMPETYFLHLTEECTALFTSHRIRRDTKALWFAKRCHFGSHGRGISVRKIGDLLKEHKIPPLPADADEDSAEFVRAASAVQQRCKSIHRVRYKNMRKELMIQRGVDPLLLKGRKFDMRVYVMIANHDPTYIYYMDGYVRYGLYKFSRTNNDVKIHIGNHDAIKKAATFNLHDHYNTLPQMKEQMLREGYTEAQFELMARRCRLVCAYVAQASLPYMRTTNGHFLMLGVDLLVDSSLHVHMVEANVNPELTLDAVRTSLNEMIISNYISLLIEVYLKVNHPKYKAQPRAQQLKTRTQWELLYTDGVDPPYSILRDKCYHPNRTQFTPKD